MPSKAWDVASTMDSAIASAKAENQRLYEKIRRIIDSYAGGQEIICRLSTVAGYAR